MRVNIERLGINGEGVSRLRGNDFENKVCFVDNALPNEEVEITITNNKKKFCQAKVDKILKQSPMRVHPLCPYFGMCGGCDLQHMDRNVQLEMKRDNISDTIKKISGQSPIVQSVVRKNDYGYRNKMVFPFVEENGKSVLGMFEKNSNKVVDVNECLLTTRQINDCLRITKEFFKQNSYRGYDFKNKCGDIKYIVVREGAGCILVTVVATKKVNLEKYYNHLKSHFERVGVSLLISDSNDEIMSGKYVHLCGEEYLELEEFGVKYRLDNRGFLQVNNDIKYELYQRILSYIDSDDCVIDAYSGAGLLSAIMSKKCNEVVGIEINNAASNSAKDLASRNKLNNIKFICGDVKNELTSVLLAYDDCVVVLDPPRSGVDESVLHILLNTNKTQKNAKNSDKNNTCRVHRIIYVSCNVATLARDLKVLSKSYDIMDVIPMDMFPQTHHCEVVIVLDVKSN